MRLGDRVALAAGTDVWAAHPVAIDFTPAEPAVSLSGVARLAGTSLSTVMRHRAGRSTRSGAAIVEALETTNYAGGWAGRVLGTRHRLTVPKVLDEPLAYLLGYFVGDGNVTKSGICLTCGDDAHARRLANLLEATLGIPASLRDDATPTGPRWRIEAHSRELLRLFEQLGIDLEARAASKQVPDAVLCSPKAVVAAFLRGYFDAGGYAGPAGIILSSASQELVRTVQVILLNYGIFSTQRNQADGCVHLEVRGSASLRFQDEIGFDLERKRAALRGYVEQRRWYKRQDPVDEIVSIETGRADVFDITVDVAHAYVANGFVNHNSLWHSRILRELDLPTDEYTEFARLHSSVAAPNRRSLNPYYVGMKMLEHVEKRWETPSEQDRERMGLVGGEGRDKLFEIRELESDLSFMRTYLTKDAIEELDLYVYAFDGSAWRIVDKKWERVRDQIVRSLTSYGTPYIVVQDGDHRRNRELYMKHHFDGDELDTAYADRTLRYVYQIWNRTVHIESVIDGKPVLLSYDGVKNTRSAL
jgi:stage V sporulation protein R